MTFGSSFGGVLNEAVLGPSTVEKVTPRVSKPDPPQSRLEVLFDGLKKASDFVRYLLNS